MPPLIHSIISRTVLPTYSFYAAQPIFRVVVLVRVSCMYVTRGADHLRGSCVKVTNFLKRFCVRWSGEVRGSHTSACITFSPGLQELVPGKIYTVKPNIRELLAGLNLIHWTSPPPSPHRVSLQECVWHLRFLKLHSINNRVLSYLDLLTQLDRSLYDISRFFTWSSQSKRPCSSTLNTSISTTAWDPLSHETCCATFARVSARLGTVFVVHSVCVDTHREIYRSLRPITHHTQRCSEPRPGQQQRQ